MTTLEDGTPAVLDRAARAAIRATVDVAAQRRRGPVPDNRLAESVHQTCTGVIGE